MKTKSELYGRSLCFFAGLAVMLAEETCISDRSEMGNITTASSSYSILAEKSLDLLASFDLETWGTMLSDSVVYYFPDGDAKNNKKIAGKKAVVEWWKNYAAVSGLKSMSIENARYMPIHIKNGIRRGDLSGTQVIAYFSNKMIYEDGEISVKMNFVIHFDKNKMIDGYYTYYDRTPIIKITKSKNILVEFASNYQSDKPAMR